MIIIKVRTHEKLKKKSQNKLTWRSRACGEGGLLLSVSVIFLKVTVPLLLILLHPVTAKSVFTTIDDEVQVVIIQILHIITMQNFSHRFAQLLSFFLHIVLPSTPTSFNNQFQTVKMSMAFVASFWEVIMISRLKKKISQYLECLREW